jgi:hypothetical protein
MSQLRHGGDLLDFPAREVCQNGRSPTVQTEQPRTFGSPSLSEESGVRTGALFREPFHSGGVAQLVRAAES